MHYMNSEYCCQELGKTPNLRLSGRKARDLAPDPAE